MTVKRADWVKVGAVLKAARQKAGLTRAQLALRTSMTAAQITKMERGECQVLFGDFVELVSALGADVGMLVGQIRKSSKGSFLS